MSLTKKYSKLRSSLKTGDLVFFNGTHLSSKSVQLVTLSRWSHVALVMTLPQYDFVCLWESLPEPGKDLDQMKVHPGVQLTPLSSRIEQFDSKIALRQLKGVTLADADIEKLVALRKKLVGRPYEKNTLDLMASAWDFTGGQLGQDLSSIFCSELVAEAYKALGLIKGGRKVKSSSEYTPADFSAKREDLPWLRGHLGPEILLKL